MKKVFIAAALLVAGLMGNEATAQVQNNSLKVNAVGMFAGQYQLAYERALNDKFTVQLSGGIVNRSWKLNWGSGSSTQKDGGFVVIPEARYYFKESMQGLYAGAFARYKNGTTTMTDMDGQKTFEATRSAVGGGAVLGYQFLIADRLLFDLFAGPQFKSASSKTTIGSQEDGTNLKGDSSGVGARIGLNIGFAF